MSAATRPTESPVPERVRIETPRGNRVEGDIVADAWDASVAHLDHLITVEVAGIRLRVPLREADPV